MRSVANWYFAVQLQHNGGLYFQSQSVRCDRAVSGWRCCVGSDDMLENWLSTGNWTQEQWLIMSVMIFIVVASLVMIVRLYSIVKMAARKRERPNLRGGRRSRD